MVISGHFSYEKTTYLALCEFNKDSNELEVILCLNNVVCSAYKFTRGTEYCFNNMTAKLLGSKIISAVKSCSAKNSKSGFTFELGIGTQYEFIKLKTEHCVQMFGKDLVGISITSGEEVQKPLDAMLAYNPNAIIPSDIQYVRMTSSEVTASTDTVVTRTVEEVALTKESVDWLKNKNYFIVNDDNTAEQIFAFLDNYKGPIAYDTETTGLFINCFGRIGSDYNKSLQKFNEENKDNPIRADKLVGIIFCVEENTSYYFPCANRKFRNLYQDGPIREAMISNLRAKYTVGELREDNSDIARYIRESADADITPDIILMERVRSILEKGHIVAHNGSFEWKVGWQYNIDTNLRDDTMLLHQIMFKFRSTTSNRGEPSNLKYLSKTELGIDQWELGDFFPDYKPNKNGHVRGIDWSKSIDFSYMDYEGTRIYAPTDGDATMGLFNKYKPIMVTTHKEQEYIYSVEILVSCAIAYMEFYGHRINEEKVLGTRDLSIIKAALLESEMRQLANYSSTLELSLYQECRTEYDRIKDIDISKIKDKELPELLAKAKELNAEVANPEGNIVNFNAPGQVADFVFNKLGVENPTGSMSIDKKVQKTLKKFKNEDGSPKYPVVELYSEFKSIKTLITKFFDNLPYFMYPGGFIFSSFGQYSTATGRMSCSKPNAQQYPKSVTKIIEPRAGYVMLDADFSQIEYRVLTALAGNEELAELFKDPDSDYHTLMASMMYEVPYASVTPKMRSDAKSFNFGIPYGMGFGSLALLLTGAKGKLQIEEAKEKYELYFKNQPKTRQFFDDVKEGALVNKYIKTFWGRYRYFSFGESNDRENNAKRASALRQAGNTIIQGSAADIFKISVARNFSYIRENGLLGLVLIINMIHDEQLLEVNVEKLNLLKVVTDVAYNMQFHVEGFPPLYVGAGVGISWGYAKGEKAEIHPLLMEQFTEEMKTTPIWTDNPMSSEEWLKYMDTRLLEFRINKIKNYIFNEENHCKELHPAIGKLLNLQFKAGLDKDVDLKPDGTKYSDTEFTTELLRRFMESNGINLDVRLFSVAEIVEDKEEDNEYIDGDEDDEFSEFDAIEGLEEAKFKLLDDNCIFGVKINDIVREFGYLISNQKKLCAIDMTDRTYKEREAIVVYMSNRKCEPDEEGALEIAFLLPGNVLNHTGVYVKDVTEASIRAASKAKLNKDYEFDDRVK